MSAKFVADLIPSGDRPSINIAYANISDAILWKTHCTIISNATD
ncbi:hypothetical protein COLSTE_00986 [Collinsella stercoris DSM 13279]|uniref:Uncharacterized protein n=1 Tax=Collinsella stercoris DSM 13279 TaxID=445975 RepID=B6GA90_9ACTN|nr:hypothetical protein COLSTE_00986 [Collinsella stercoris DSM 13279]